MLLLNSGEINIIYSTLSKDNIRIHVFTINNFTITTNIHCHIMMIACSS